MHFRGTVGVVGAESDPEPAGGKNHGFDLARGLGPDDVDLGLGGDEPAVDALEQRHAARRLDAERLQVVDAMLQPGGIAAGPAGDHEIIDRNLDRLAPAADMLHQAAHPFSL
jgi:hypothetical protein